MKKLLKFNEMLEKPVYTLRGLVLGDELEGKYKITTEGLHAIYKALYNGDSIDGAFEFATYLTENGSIDIDTVFPILSEFIYDALSNSASDKKIVESIYEGEHLNYFDDRNSMFEEFENGEYSDWAYEVADLLGFGEYFEEK